MQSTRRMFDESNISEQTHQINLESFPNRLKISFVDLLITERSPHDQLLIIYYNEYKKSRLFSFEHLCRTMDEIVDIPINRLILKYKNNGDWDLSNVPRNKLKYINNHLLVKI